MSNILRAESFPPARGVIPIVRFRGEADMAVSLGDVAV